jgi:hypothetical protein
MLNTDNLFIAPIYCGTNQFKYQQVDRSLTERGHGTV